MSEVAEKNVITIEPRNLAVNLNEQTLQALREQRSQLIQFIQRELKEGKDGDYWQIPGTPKKSLLKPGAEKLAKIFRLGSRIVDKKEHIDHKEGFGFFSYVIEIFDLRTGTAIAQCEGSTNSREKKYASKPLWDQINSLQKMAQKRAYVGAIIIAVGASDFFTQDMEDLVEAREDKSQALNRREVKEVPSEAQGSGLYCHLCGEEMKLSQKGSHYYCPSFKDESKGKHSICKKEDAPAHRAKQSEEPQESFEEFDQRT